MGGSWGERDGSPCYNPPRNLTSGSPEHCDPPHPRSNVVIGKQSGAEVFFFDRVPCCYQHCIMGGAGSEKDEAKTPEVKFRGGW